MLLKKYIYSDQLHSLCRPITRLTIFVSFFQLFITTCIQCDNWNYKSQSIVLIHSDDRVINKTISVVKTLSNYSSTSNNYMANVFNRICVCEMACKSLRQRLLLHISVWNRKGFRKSLLYAAK